MMKTWSVLLILLFFLHANATPLSSLQPSFNGLLLAGCANTSSQWTTAQQFLVTDPDTGLFDINQPLSNNELGITQFTDAIVETTHAIKFQNVNSYFTMKSWLVMPVTSKLKGVVVFFHGVLFSLGEIPSLKSDIRYKALAGLYVSRGYAILFPDYLGQETPNKNPHPFVLYPQQNVQSVIDALNQAYWTLTNTYGSNKPYPLFTFGHSEGAAYSIWFGRCVTQRSKCPYCSSRLDKYQYTLMKTAGIAGAYDVANVMLPFMEKEVQLGDDYHILSQQVTNLAKPGLIALALRSYAFYSIMGANSSYAFSSEFYQLQCPTGFEARCKIRGTKPANIDAALTLNVTSAEINGAIAVAAGGKTRNNQTYALLPAISTSSQNSILAFTDKLIFNSHYFRSLAADASIIDFGSTKPIFLFSLTNDSVVSVKNTNNFADKNAKKVYLDNSNIQVCTTPIASVDHAQVQLIASIYVLNAFRTTPNSSGRRLFFDEQATLEKEIKAGEKSD